MWPYSLPTFPRGLRTVKGYQRAFICELWFFSTEKQPSGRYCLDLDWHLLLWKCSRTNYHNLYNLSTPPVIMLEDSHHFVSPAVKVSFFAFLPWFFKFCWILQWFCFGFSLLVFASISQWESLLGSRSGLVVVNMLFFMHIFMDLAKLDIFVIL